MTAPLRLFASLAHPDDESLGVGGTLVHYAEQSIETFLLTATFGDRGRYKGIREGEGYPGPAGMARIREGELRAAAAVLGVHEVIGLGYPDGGLDRVAPREVIAKIAAALRRVRPQVVITFGPDGAYGHPDHIAISQLTTAAIVAAASPAVDPAIPGEPHAVSKLYYMAWAESSMAAYTESSQLPSVTIDEVLRRPVGWPDWEITTRVDALAYFDRVWKAVECHDSQSASWAGLAKLSKEERQVVWGVQTYYRVFSLVNGGRVPETDLFAGLRG